MSEVQKRTISQLMQSEMVQKRLAEIVGKRSSVFTSSVLQITKSNAMLQKCTPESILNAAIMSATLDLPINNGLGFVYIVPYGKDAQFQIGWKGYVQLAYRSGQFKSISVTPIYEGQIVSENPLIGFEFDFSVKSEKVIGYASYFKLLNGFEKTLYMTVEQIEAHAKQFSQTYKKGFGVWKDNFEAMAMKTSIKLLLSKWAPLSVEMQQAVLSDSAVIENVNGIEDVEVSYVDNEVDDRKENLLSTIEKTNTVEALELLQESVKELNDDEVMNAYIDKQSDFLN